MLPFETVYVDLSCQTRFFFVRVGALMGPPGQVLAGPDMSDFRRLVEFRMFRVQNLPSIFGVRDQVLDDMDRLGPAMQTATSDIQDTILQSLSF